MVGADALLGQTAVVLKPLEPVGQVVVQGEIWEAESATPALRDQRVRVTGVSGLTLHVEPLPRPGTSTPAAVGVHFSREA